MSNLLLRLDERVSYNLHRVSKPYLSIYILLILEYSADFRLFFPISLSIIFRSQFLFPFLAGLLIDLALIGLIKLIFRRSRPHYNHQSMKAVVHADCFSFPSGHASRVCFVAAAVCFNFQIANGVRFAVFLWATLTALSRVLLGRHYLSDVAVGACLGVAEALLVFRFIRFY
ncbi:hypothetical protein ACFE04_014410 [Oxalis oulophora]